MPGAGVFIILLLVSSIPVILVFIWFRLARYPFSPSRFSASLLAGAGSFFPALLFQNILTDENGLFHAAGKWGLVTRIFIRIALTEEFSRLLVLIVLFVIINRFARLSVQAPNGTNISPRIMAGASGLIAGLGFAILESAVYGASNTGNVLLRTFTAAPLHGACGFRVGSSIEMWRENPIQAVLRFLTAVIIHGVYNFMLLIPGILPPIAAILIALSSLASSIVTIRSGMLGEGVW